MIENSEKEVKVVDNTKWKERHQFVLSANGNIICQRYFKVNGFNPSALRSVELYYTFREAVQMIKDDLVSKSRIYTGITANNRSKLTGFYSGDDLTMDDWCLICSSSIDGNIPLSNGVVVNKSFVDFNNTEEEETNEPFEFKFSYLYDDKVMYEEVWDGTVYPRYIRNSVDLSNSNASYKYADPMRMSFVQQMTKYLTEGRGDLIYAIIKKFCNTLSDNIDENGVTSEKDYTYVLNYGSRTFVCNPFPRKYIREWANAVKDKTVKHRKWIDNDFSD